MFRRCVLFEIPYVYIDGNFFVCLAGFDGPMGGIRIGVDSDPPFFIIQST